MDISDIRVPDTSRTMSGLGYDPTDDPDNPFYEEPTFNHPGVEEKSNSSTSSLDSMLADLEKRAQRGDTAAFEKLFDYYASRDAAKSANDWTAQREDTQYQRLIADLKKAGISPYILSGATPGVSQAQFSTTTGSQMTSKKNNDDSNARAIGTSIFSGILSLMATAMWLVAIA